MLEISKGFKLEKLTKKNDSEIKPIFIIGVPRCGSTLVEKIITSGKKFIPAGEETAVLENFINSKILEEQSLNLGNVEDIRNEISDVYKSKGLILNMRYISVIKPGIIFGNIINILGIKPIFLNKLP